MPTCARCHAPTGERDRFCMQCGHRLGEEPAPPVPAVDEDVTDAALPVVAPPPEVDAPELVACPTCGSSNAGGRRRCARCGAGLRGDGAVVLDEHDGGEDHPTGAPLSGWDEDQHDATARAHRMPRRGRGIGVAVVGLGILIGAGVGAAAGMGMGPFARVEAVPFDADAYATDPRTLRPATAGSSSTAPAADGRTFGPERTVDADLTTAWRPDDEERGARLRHGFVGPVWVDRLEVATGDQADEDVFAAVPQVTEVEVDLGTQRVEVTLAPEPGVQLVQLPEPVLVDQVTWEVTDTTGGPGALSEVVYVGWQADEADREAFRTRG